MAHAKTKHPHAVPTNDAIAERADQVAARWQHLLEVVDD